MNLFDIFVLGTTALFLAAGLWKGLIKQTLSLAGMVAGWYLAGRFYGKLSGFLYISNENIAGIAAFLIILLGCMILSFILIRLLDKIIEEAGLNLSNRMLGGLVGVLKAGVIVICASLFLVAALPSDNKTLRDSVSLPIVMEVAEAATDFVPAKIKEQFDDKLKELKNFWKSKISESI